MVMPFLNSMIQSLGVQQPMARGASMTMTLPMLLITDFCTIGGYTPTAETSAQVGGTPLRMMHSTHF